MRLRKRYIVFESTGKKSVSDVQKSLIFLRREQVSKLGFRLVFYDERSQRGLVRCGHLDLEKVKEDMSRSGNFRILGVSGTIKGAKRKFLAKG